MSTLVITSPDGGSDCFRQTPSSFHALLCEKDLNILNVKACAFDVSETDYFPEYLYPCDLCLSSYEGLWR